jgi:hypothetical protein
MNPAMIGAMADQHIREVRRQAARQAGAAGRREPRQAGDVGRRPRLRSHLGFALIEAGFYLLASSPLASRD